MRSFYHRSKPEPQKSHCVCKKKKKNNKNPVFKVLNVSNHPGPESFEVLGLLFAPFLDCFPARGEDTVSSQTTSQGPGWTFMPHSLGFVVAPIM